jgi:hypothetical protein
VSESTGSSLLGELCSRGDGVAKRQVKSLAEIFQAVSIDQRVTTLQTGKFSGTGIQPTRLSSNGAWYPKEPAQRNSADKLVISAHCHDYPHPFEGRKIMMHYRILLLLVAILMPNMINPYASRAESIGFIEKYALASDRQAVLDELIPGSEEYYFFHALHYQVTGQLDLAEAKLAEWEKRIGDDSASRVAIRDRQRLLTYGASPDRTIDYLRNRLAIRLDHTAPVQAGERRWPGALDQNVIDPQALIREATGNRQNLTPLGLTILADSMLDGKASDYGVDLTWLTQQMNQRFYPRLGELVIAELNSRRPENRQFGDRPAHSNLTTEELRAVATAFPAFTGNREWVSQMLTRMRPDADSDIAQQPDVRFEYLKAVNAFAQTLPESENSLKAAALHRLLEAHFMRGEFPLPLFLDYLKLPRQSPIVYLPRPNERRQPVPFAANLNEDFSATALLPPIRDERPLVRSFLEHFLLDADSTATFDGLIETGYLSQAFAETKLLNGVGDPQRWYGMLDADARQRLTDRVELTLAETNPTFSDPQVKASVTLDVKGVDELIVRVYEINSQAYYRTHTEPIDTNIDLDGLVAADEQRIEYKFPKVRRHRETIALENVNGRGVWVVDFLGGGLRSRAILRRGELRFIEGRTADGQVFTVLDEARQPAPSARMLVAGREWTADEQGQIHLPPVDQALTRATVVMDDELAVPVLFMQIGESYSLDSAMVINREQLQTGQMANLVIRPRLNFAGTPIDPATLKNPTVVVTAVDQDGIETTKRFENLELGQLSETVVQFRVPGRLAKINATLSGQIAMLSTGREVSLSDSESWEINGINQTSKTMDVHVTRNGEDWIAEVRGLNGEAVPGAGLSVTLNTIYRASPVQLMLESDANGQVVLGPLRGVQMMTLSLEGTVRSVALDGDSASWPDRMHGVVGRVLKLPIANTDSMQANDLALISLRGGQPAEDLSKTMLKIENGLLVIGELPAGDYRLTQRIQGVYQSISIAITAGPEITNVAAGQVRNLDLKWAEPVSISAIDRDDAGMRIQLSGDFGAARVHVMGTRYLSPNPAMQLPIPMPGTSGVQRAKSGYVSDLRLGDEYLYVLRRQYAKKYPGVMLPAPSLLIAPWATDETENASQVVAAGMAPPKSAAPAPSDMAADAMMRSKMDRQQESSSQSLEFLPSGALMLDNRLPDENGVVQIDAELLKGSSVVTVFVLDPFATVQRTVFGELEPLEARDRRLPRPLPATNAYTFEREVLVAGPERPLEMASIGTAQVQVYSTVAEILQLYRTISGDDRLDQFNELGRWQTLDDGTKRSLYGRLACNELHVFLKYKDALFFDSVVRPYLENKKEKKLVDAWLLDQDLTPWTELWQYTRLNAFEKAILARSIPSMRDVVAREFRERLAMRRSDPAALRQLIEFGLAGKAMESNDGLSIVMSTTTDAFGDDMYAFAEAEEAMPMAGAGGGRGGAPGAAQANKAMRMESLSLERLGRGIASTRGRGQGQSFFQQLDSTKQWADNHWDQIRVASADEKLIPIDPFWMDWVLAEGNDLLVSQNLLRPTSNRHSTLIALALLDMPFESKGAELPSEKEATYRPDHSVAIITKRLRSLEPASEPASLLVGQRFETAKDHGSGSEDPFGNTDDVKIAPDEYLTGRAYMGQIVITNPTPQSQKVDVLWQIPAGSLPVSGSQATDSRSLEVQPFEVQRIEYQFYFPSPGAFEHYPVCISRDAEVIARGEGRTFQVVASPTTIDEASWQEVAQRGSAEKIAQFLNDANLHKLDWSLVTHRLRERAIYDVVMPQLQTARIWQPELWAYAMLHRDQPRLTSYLEQRTDLVGSVGPVFNSTLLTVEPIERAIYEHLEYAPLVPARIHSLRPEPEIMNNRLLDQYRSLMRLIAYQPETVAEQDLALTYYMLLQNRIEEAIERFNSVDRTKISMQLQYDYLEAYLALHQGNYERAGQIAQQHAAHPVPRWRERFSQMESQLRQRRDLFSGTQLVGSGPKASDLPSVREDAADLAMMDREVRQQEGAIASPDVRVRVEGDALVIDHRNAKEVSIRFYGIDLELLFSKTPFVRDGLERMATVRPGRTETLALGEGDGSAKFTLDETLARQTLLVEVVADGARDTTLYYGGKLKTYVSEGFGQLQVSDRGTGEPVSTAYVKVYSKDSRGNVQFYKDGYTDLRGRFDFATLSSGDLSEVDKLAILVLDPERGATLHEVNPPTK